MIHEFYDLDKQASVVASNVIAMADYSTATGDIGFAELNLPAMPPPLTVPAPAQQCDFQTVQTPYGYVDSYYGAKLCIREQPMEQFHFRYISEMQGPHGSLCGSSNSSKRSAKTCPEVELCDYDGPAVIRCTLYQYDVDSPHSHDLVVRKGAQNLSEPHDIHVSAELGYRARFQNMGILHTPKKQTYETLLRKKQQRLLFRLGRGELTARQLQELQQQTETEARKMNLNQVRLCFEAYRIEYDQTWLAIAPPVYSDVINNKKSAEAGSLKIVRLSIASGSVLGNDELILLVEKVSKKQIQVRFYELNADQELVWQDFARFGESDVHHQYAIVCRTPPYMHRDIECNVEVFVQLVRPKDDKRSLPLTFVYKPRDAALAARKRRRTSSSTNSSFGTGSMDETNELPKAVMELQPAARMEVALSEDFNKDYYLRQLIGDETTPNYNAEINELQLMDSFADFLSIFESEVGAGNLERDGGGVQQAEVRRSSGHYLQGMLAAANQHDGAQLRRNVARLFLAHANSNAGGDTLLHEWVVQPTGNTKILSLLRLLKQLRLATLINRCTNLRGESPLHYCAQYGQPKLIRPLLSLGCDPNIQDQHGNTVTHVAVIEDQLECIRNLLEATAETETATATLNLTLRNDEGLTALQLSVRQEHLKITKFLIACSNNAIEVRNARDGNTALHMAVLQGNEELVGMLLKSPNIDKILHACNSAGFTPLALARRRKTAKARSMLALLLEQHKLFGISEIVDSDVKEETLSECSSEDNDDDDDDIDATEIHRAAAKLEDIKIEDVNEGLRSMLADDQIFNKLVDLLNEMSVRKAPKWKELAALLDIQHFVFLWRDAASLLGYLKNQRKDLSCDEFVRVLEKVDPAAAQLLDRT